jgi:hypothetical protein
MLEAAQGIFAGLGLLGGVLPVPGTGGDGQHRSASVAAVGAEGRRGQVQGFNGRDRCRDSAPDRQRRRGSAP